MAFHSSTAPPPPPSSSTTPRFLGGFFILHVNLGRKVYILVFKAALFSVKCCVATSKGLPDRAFLGFQHGRRIIGGRPQRIWQMCDEFLLSAAFFFSFLSLSVVCLFVCVRGENTRAFFVVLRRSPPPPKPAAGASGWPSVRVWAERGGKHYIQTRYLNPACGI